VHVLKHEHGQTPRAQVPRERRYDLVRDRAAVYNLLELAAGVLGDKEQRPERPRSKERIARAPQDLRRLMVLLAELPQECALPHTGFAGDQNDAPMRAALHFREARAERR
jgi:hypothetical protein